MLIGLQLVGAWHSYRILFAHILSAPHHPQSTAQIAERIIHDKMKNKVKRIKSYHYGTYKWFIRHLCWWNRVVIECKPLMDNYLAHPTGLAQKLFFV